MNIQHQNLSLQTSGGSTTGWMMGPTCGPSGADSTQVGPMLAPWTLLSGMFYGGDTGTCSRALSEGSMPIMSEFLRGVARGFVPTGILNLRDTFRQPLRSPVCVYTYTYMCTCTFIYIYICAYAASVDWFFNKVLKTITFFYNFIFVRIRISWLKWNCFYPVW